MKRYYNIFKTLLFLSLTSLFLQCTVEDIEGIESAYPFVKLDSTSLTIPAMNASEEVPIKTNRKVTATVTYMENSDNDWLHVSISANGKTMVITAEDNLSYSARTASITLTTSNGLVSTQYNVYQHPLSDADLGGLVNLSENGTANCYIVSDAGHYRFDASYKGNSLDLVGKIAAVEVLWETIGTTPAKAGTVINDVRLSGNNVMFAATGVEGNALIAVNNSSGTILWSWHIWVTDFPTEKSYTNLLGDYTLMDRNLGAIRSVEGDNADQWKESLGTFYQWGRKDPLLLDMYSKNTSITSVSKSIQHPTEHATLTAWHYQSHWDISYPYDLWLNYEKTKYDPCPPGYKVADADAYYGIEYESRNYGVNIKFDNNVTSWFPHTGVIWCSGDYSYPVDDVIVWASGIFDKSFTRLQIPKDEPWKGYDNAAMGSPVRCMVYDEDSENSEHIDRVSVAEFIAAPVNSDKWYMLTGKITEIQNTTYGNFYLADDTDTIYVYGLNSSKITGYDKKFSNLGLDVRDIVTLIGTRSQYGGIPQVGGPAYYVSHEEADNGRYLVGNFNGWGITNKAKLVEEGDFYVYRNLVLNTEDYIYLIFANWEEIYGSNQKFCPNIPIDVIKDGEIITVPAGRYDVYLSSDFSKLYFMTDGKSPVKNPDSEKPGGTEGLPNEGYEWE